MKKSSSSSGLFALQKQFQNYLLDEHEGIEQSVVNSKLVSSSKRLTIYQDAYQARLIEALAYNYPILQKYLGTTYFNQISILYLKRYPSYYRSIRWFGENLPAFLTNNENEIVERVLLSPKPYLSELAQFEWRLGIAFDSADEAHLTEAMLTNIPSETWPSLGFTPHISFQRVNFNWNVVSLWKAISNDEELPELIKDKIFSDWIIWRKDYQCHFYCLTVDESLAWDAILKKENFASICFYLQQWFIENNLGSQNITHPDINNEVSLHAASLLKKWIESGLLSAHVESFMQ